MRLVVVLAGDDSIQLTEEVKADMEYFISQYEKEPVNLNNLRIKDVTNAEIIQRLKDVYLA